MKTIKKIVVIAALLFTGMGSSKATAQACGEYTEAPSSSSPLILTIIDTEVGTDAYQRLVTYSNGGHKALGMAIASSYNYLDKCQYIGIGIGDGSGGNGFRPNYTLAIWYEGVDLSVARSAIYSLIGASSNPVVTNGDCNISCDGTTGRQFDGTIATTTTTIPETTTTTTTTVQPVVAPVVAPVGSREPVEEVVINQEEVTIVPVEEPVIIETTTTTVLISVEAVKSTLVTVATAKQTLTNKKKPKRVVVQRRK
jgi:hypothetical protein